MIRPFRAGLPTRLRARSGLVIALALWIGAVLALPATASANARYAGFVMEATTGEVFYQENADAYLYPASLTKMMTLYLLFQALEQNVVSLNTGFRVSPTANAEPPTRINLVTGGTIAVEQAIYALITRSANNVAVVVAENLAGSEAEFARRMTLQAQRLGMSRTTFRNASGLPNAAQRSTARDMARLAQALLRDFPQYYGYFATQSWSWRGTTYNNHNRLLGRYAGMDGLKTGYIRASGYNLVASAERGRLRLIGVVFGGRSGASRNEHMAEILDRAFESERGRYLIANGTRPFTPPIPMARPARPGEAPRFAGAPTAPAQDPLAPLVAAALAPADGDPMPLVPTAYTAAGTRPAAAAPAAPVAVGSADAPLSPAAAEAAAILGLAAPSGTRHVAAVAAGAAQATAPAVGAPIGSGGDWGIQVGAFATPSGSQQALMSAARAVPDLLGGTTPRIVPVDTDQGQLFRARLFGLDQAAAALACQALTSQGRDCFAVAPGG